MDVMNVIAIALTEFYLFLPAMLPNSAAVVFGKYLPTKMDFGKSWCGRRIFGDGKSWGGFFGGVFAGIVLGLILCGIAALLGSEDFWGFGIWPGCLKVIVCLAFGAALGDLAGAFIKRRVGLERGAKAPILDQYDFVMGAMCITALFNPGWVYSMYIESWHIVAFILFLLMMFAIHRGMNVIGYKMGLKKEPW